MKIGRIHTLWIMFLSALFTVNTCGRAVIKRLFGSITRPWVDKTLHLWVERILRSVGIRCVVINPHQVTAIPGRPTIIMCNHTSLYDIPISLKAFPTLSIRMLSKKELAKVPVMGKGMEAAEFPFIDRKNRHQAIKDLEVVQKLLESGIVLWIAPEGTRSKDGKLAPFKKGGFITAINAKAMIIPIGIRGAFDILPARTFQVNLNQTAEVHVGEAIDAALYTLENKDELVNKTYEAMKKLIGETN